MADRPPTPSAEERVRVEQKADGWYLLLDDSQPGGAHVHRYGGHDAESRAAAGQMADHIRAVIRAAEQASADRVLRDFTEGEFRDGETIVLDVASIKDRIREQARREERDQRADELAEKDAEIERLKYRLPTLAPTEEDDHG